MAHRFSGKWKIYNVSAEGDIGLHQDELNNRTKIKIKKQGNEWRLEEKQRLTWDETEVTLTPDPDNDPEFTTFDAVVHINTVPHSVRIDLRISEGDVLDDELHFDVRPVNGGLIAQGTANAGRG